MAGDSDEIPGHRFKQRPQNVDFPSVIPDPTRRIGARPVQGSRGRAATRPRVMITLMAALLGLMGCAQAELQDGYLAGVDAGQVDMASPQYTPPERVVVNPFADSCAHNTIRAQALPLDIILTIDKSGSMLETLVSGTTKWDAMRSAFADFFRSSTGAIGVGLHFFPQSHPGVPSTCESNDQCGAQGPCVFFKACTGQPTLRACSLDSDCGGQSQCAPLGECLNKGTLCLPVGSSCGGGLTCQPVPGRCDARDRCDVQAYVMPAIDVSPLPGAASALLSSFDDQMPDGSTPTGPALQGAIAHAKERAQQNPSRRMAVVLATDGFPTGCSPNNIGVIATEAAAAQSSSPSVPTFVIGVFSPQEAFQASTNLDRIAQAGGKRNAFIVNTSGNVGQGFLQALNDIRAAALSCEYALPPDETSILDYGAVNVIHTGKGQQRSTTVGFVQNEANCHPQKGGWYYDQAPMGAQKPSLIHTCPKTCDLLRADAGGRVDLVFGCKTVIIN